MRPEIRTLEDLNERWPGFFDMIRAQNGYEVESFSYQDLMRVNEAMLNDEEGMETFVRAMMSLQQDRALDPEISRWFEDNGFVEKRTVDLKRKLESLKDQILTGQISDEERNELTRELKEVQKRSRLIAEKGAKNMGRSFLGLRTILGDQ